jgi:hypothetical protein
VTTPTDRDLMAKALHATAPRNHPPAPMLRSICMGHEPHLDQARQILDIYAARADAALAPASPVAERESVVIALMADHADCERAYAKAVASGRFGDVVMHEPEAHARLDDLTEEKRGAVRNG